MFSVVKEFIIEALVVLTFINVHILHIQPEEQKSTVYDYNSAARIEHGHLSVSTALNYIDTNNWQKVNFQDIRRRWIERKPSCIVWFARKVVLELFSIAPVSVMTRVQVLLHFCPEYDISDKWFCRAESIVYVLPSSPVFTLVSNTITSPKKSGNAQGLKLSERGY